MKIGREDLRRRQGLSGLKIVDEVDFQEVEGEHFVGVVEVQEEGVPFQAPHSFRQDPRIFFPLETLISLLSLLLAWRMTFLSMLFEHFLRRLGYYGLLFAHTDLTVPLSIMLREKELRLQLHIAKERQSFQDVLCVYNGESQGHWITWRRTSEWQSRDKAETRQKPSGRLMDRTHAWWMVDKRLLCIKD